MITIDGNGVIIDIRVMGQEVLRGYSFDSSFVRSKDIEVYAFREVYTAGFALPTYQLIMASTDEDYLNSFNEQNTIQITIGTSLNELNTYTCDTIGKSIKKDGSGTKFILNWGGVISKNKLNSTFLKSVGYEVYNGNALSALLSAWTSNTGCGIDNQIAIADAGITRDWRRSRQTLNNYMIDLMTHIDVRPSFPLATIDEQGRLVLRDFKTLKSRGVSHTFVPTNNHMKSDQIGYTGGLTVNSFKTYSNRFCGYIQKSGRDLKTGEVYTIGNNMQDTTAGWGINTLATTKANEQSPIEHQSNESPNVLISETTPISHHETYVFNVTQLVNMSSIQVKLIVEGSYMQDVRVLDLIQINTGVSNDVNNGKYIIEAVEKGFIGKAPFRTLVYACRENSNDVEQYQAGTYKKLALKELRIPSSTKAALITAIRASRRSLVYARGVMDNTFINEYEQHLISMKRGFLSNFYLTNTNFNFNDTQNTVLSLRNGGQQLMNRIVNKYVASPYSTMFINGVLGDSTLMNLFFGILSGLLGTDLYSEFSQLIGDLQTFDTFLYNYNNTVSSVAVTSSPAYVEELTSGTVTFSESPSGELITYTITEDTDNMTYTAEEKSIMVSEIVTEVTERIPEAVDIPIPEITITDSEAIQPSEQLEETVIEKIVDHLIDQGYVYDSEIYDAVDSSGAYINNTVTFTKADGTTMTAATARSEILSSSVMTQILNGTRSFDSTSAMKIKGAVGTDMSIRHWGTFNSEDDLASFNIPSSFVEKYRTLNATKILSARGGKKIFVALPASETNVLFYINSVRVTMNETEYDNIGYYDSRNLPIPYIIYYTTDSYNSTNLTLEIRRRGS